MRDDRNQRLLTELTRSVSSVLGQIRPATVRARVKPLDSHWRKMRALGQGSGVRDVLGLRIIVSTPDACYQVIEAIHEAFEPIPGEFDDYIRHPKPNGYRSLHTTVHGPGRRAVEVQVRTHEMHVCAEEGSAAHAGYKSSQVP